MRFMNISCLQGCGKDSCISCSKLRNQEISSACLVEVQINGRLSVRLLTTSWLKGSYFLSKILKKVNVYDPFQSSFF